MQVIYRYKPSPIGLMTIFRDIAKYGCHCDYVVEPCPASCVLAMEFYYRNWYDIHCNCGNCNRIEVPYA